VAADAGEALREHLEPTVIQAEVRRSFGRMRECYDRGLARDPKLRGGVKVRFVIGRNGAVVKSEDYGSSVPDPEVVRCIVDVYGTLTFPQPKEGIVTVVYPFVLTPGDEERDGG
jgi:hypothetical protein